jgi:hypothetical protein
MILIPFGFMNTLTSPGGEAPINLVAALLTIIDSAARTVQYTPGEWEGSDSVSFAWFFNDAIQTSLNDQTSATVPFSTDVKITETATNEFGVTELSSNIINIPPPDYYDSGSVDWTMNGALVSSAFELPVNDTGAVIWTANGEIIDSLYEDTTEFSEDSASITWEVFGSLV